MTRTELEFSDSQSYRLTNLIIYTTIRAVATTFSIGPTVGHDAGGHKAQIRMTTMETLERVARPNGTITTVIRVLEDRGSVVVPPQPDNYKAKAYYAEGVNRWDVNVWCSDIFAPLVEMAKDGYTSMLERVRCWQTVTKASDAQIMEAYGASFVFKSASRALHVLASMVAGQADGQSKGPLLTSGFANVVHVQVDGKVWWLRGHWLSGIRFWYFDARTIPSSFGWDAGDQFFSDDS